MLHYLHLASRKHVNDYSPSNYQKSNDYFQKVNDYFQKVNGIFQKVNGFFR